jgi:hypothetical protein
MIDAPITGGLFGQPISFYCGSTCGRWPMLAVWLSICPLADRHGHIDMTPEAISALTGWPLDLLREGIRQLCEPDPEGRWLELVDPSRSWGWRVANYRVHRERLRLKRRETERVACGANRERMRKRRRKTPA